MRIVGQDFVQNGRVITRDILQAISYLEKNDYEGFGKGVASTMSDALLKNQQKVQAAEITKGFLEAMDVGSIDITALLFCVFYEDEAVLMAMSTVAIVKDALAHKTYLELVVAALTAVNTVKQAEAGLVPCSHVIHHDLDWTKFHQVEKDLKTSKVTIEAVEEVMKTIEDYKAGNWEAFGSDLANVILDAEKKEKMFLF